jgi:hypothetical protein
MPHLTAQKAQELKELNLSLNLFAAYFVAVEIVFAAVSVAVGALIFWRRSNDRMAFLVSFMLLTSGAAIPIPLFTLDLSPLDGIGKGGWVPRRCIVCPLRLCFSRRSLRAPLVTLACVGGDSGGGTR